MSSLGLESRWIYTCYVGMESYAEEMASRRSSGHLAEAIRRTKSPTEQEVPEASHCPLLSYTLYRRLPKILKY